MGCWMGWLRAGAVIAICMAWVCNCIIFKTIDIMTYPCGKLSWASGLHFIAVLLSERDVMYPCDL